MGAEGVTVDSVEVKDLVAGLVEIPFVRLGEGHSGDLVEEPVVLAALGLVDAEVEGEGLDLFQLDDLLEGGEFPPLALLVEGRGLDQLGDAGHKMG